MTGNRNGVEMGVIRYGQTFYVVRTDRSSDEKSAKDYSVADFHFDGPPNRSNAACVDAYADAIAYCRRNTARPFAGSSK